MPVLGLKEVQAALERVTKEADAASKTIVVKSAALVITAAKGNFEGSHSVGQAHVGGDKPNVVSGNLRRSIEMTSVQRLGLANYGVTVGPTAIYGRRVELGYNGSPGYPYFSPAVETTREPISTLAHDTWAAFLR